MESSTSEYMFMGAYGAFLVALILIMVFVYIARGKIKDIEKHAKQDDIDEAKSLLLWVGIIDLILVILTLIVAIGGHFRAKESDDNSKSKSISMIFLSITIIIIIIIALTIGMVYRAHSILDDISPEDEAITEALGYIKWAGWISLISIVTGIIMCLVVLSRSINLSKEETPKKDTDTEMEESKKK